MKQPKGVLVLLSLVILSIIVTAGLVLGTIIVRDVRQSSISDKGVTALYASETAAEESIYHVFKLGEDPLTLTSSGTLSNGASWTRESKKTDRRFIVDFLQESSVAEFNLYNNTRPNQSANVEAVGIDWSSGSTMQVELLEWDGATLSSLGIQSTPVCTTSPCPHILITTPISTRAYQLFITALNEPITDLIVSALDTNGDPVQVEIPVTVVATGVYKGAKQAIQLRVPQPAPWGASTPLPPPAAVCGNSVVESGEACDDGNADEISCTSSCTVPPAAAVCGNSIMEGSEFCDDGNTTSAGICNATCTALTTCGDGTIQNPNGFSVAEQCDDSNTANGDGCSSTCQTEAPPVLTTIVITPNPGATTGFVTGSATLASLQFTAQGKDQFGNNMVISPAPTWAKVSGCGFLNASGLYSPCGTDVNFSVKATSGAIVGTASGSVTCPPCTTLNLAGQSVQLDGAWTGSYVAYSIYRSYPQCGGSYYSASHSLITSFAATCANTYPINNCATYYQAVNSSPNWFGGDTYGWGVIEVGRYKKYDYPQYPTVTLSQGAEQLCK